eukprot:619046-Rhodomonas_salina.4
MSLLQSAQRQLFLLNSPPPACYHHTRPQYRAPPRTRVARYTPCNDCTRDRVSAWYQNTHFSTGHDTTLFAQYRTSHSRAWPVPGIA